LFLISNNDIQFLLIFLDDALILLDLFLVGEDQLLILQNDFLVRDDVGFGHILAVTPILLLAGARGLHSPLGHAILLSIDPRVNNTFVLSSVARYLRISSVWFSRRYKGRRFHREEVYDYQLDPGNCTT
jgi:hypothetical protein